MFPVAGCRLFVVGLCPLNRLVDLLPVFVIDDAHRLEIGIVHITELTPGHTVEFGQSIGIHAQTLSMFPNELDGDWTAERQQVVERGGTVSECRRARR